MHRDTPNTPGRIGNTYYHSHLRDLSSSSYTYTFLLPLHYYSDILSLFTVLLPFKVSLKEMWNILCEMKLRGSMTKVQFEKCVKYVLQDETGKDDDMVRS